MNPESIPLWLTILLVMGPIWIGHVILIWMICKWFRSLHNHQEKSAEEVTDQIWQHMDM